MNLIGERKPPFSYKIATRVKNEPARRNYGTSQTTELIEGSVYYDATKAKRHVIIKDLQRRKRGLQKRQALLSKSKQSTKRAGLKNKFAGQKNATAFGAYRCRLANGTTIVANSARELHEAIQARENTRRSAFRTSNNFATAPKKMISTNSFINSLKITL